MQMLTTYALQNAFGFSRLRPRTNLLWVLPRIQPAPDSIFPTLLAIYPKPKTSGCSRVFEANSTLIRRNVTSESSKLIITQTVKLLQHLSGDRGPRPGLTELRTAAYERHALEE